MKEAIMPIVAGTAAVCAVALWLIICVWFLYQSIAALCPPPCLQIGLVERLGLSMAFLALAGLILTIPILLWAGPPNR